MRTRLSFRRRRRRNLLNQQISPRKLVEMTVTVIVITLIMSKKFWMGTANERLLSIEPCTIKHDHS